MKPLKTALSKSSYHHLPSVFYQNAHLADMPSPSLVAWNDALGDDLQIQKPSEAELIDFLGSQEFTNLSPIALTYSGHQFGHFAPVLGDGRALLIGELRDIKSSTFDLQLKGSGPTPFSRGGDGKSPLGPALREYLVSEAMHHLGIATTRSLFVLTTGETVYRHEMLPGGILGRTARSHIRCGTFEYFTARGDTDNLQKLFDYTVERNYPELASSDQKIVDFFQSVNDRLAKLVADWMGVGFVHGVMNTDNVALSGETLDYGPCAFLDEYHSNKVFSSIDRNGRYAFTNQPVIMQWNLTLLHECLSRIAKSNDEIHQMSAILQKFQLNFKSRYVETFSQKLGFVSTEEDDGELIQKWLDFMEKEGLDFTLSFSHLSELYTSGSPGNLFPDTPDFRDFFAHWSKRMENQKSEETLSTLSSANPVYIPRNHLIEELISKSYTGDFELFYDMLSVVRNPFTRRRGMDRFAVPPSQAERVQKTFCGT